MHLPRLLKILWIFEIAGWGIFLWQTKDICPVNGIVDGLVYPPPGFLFWCTKMMSLIAFGSLACLIVATIAVTAFGVIVRSRKGRA